MTPQFHHCISLKLDFQIFYSATREVSTHLAKGRKHHWNYTELQQKYRSRYTIKPYNYKTPHTIVLWKRRMGRGDIFHISHHFLPSPPQTEWGRKQERFVSFNSTPKHTLSNCKWVTPSDEHKSDHPPLSHTEKISQQAPTGNSGVGIESWEPDTTMFLSLKSQTSSEPRPRNLVHS